MGKTHAQGYNDLDGVDLAACADIDEEGARWFAEEYGIPAANVFTDYRTMLAEIDLDLVSVCTPINTHADIVSGCVTSGEVRGVHCEKPIAHTWGDCRRMVAEAEEHGVQLTINHQLRHCEPARRIQELLDAGEIGELQRTQLSRGDIFEAGIHLVDLCCFFADDAAPSWVIGQVDYRDVERWKGTYVENQTVGLWEHENGVFGLAVTGHGTGAIDANLRLIGTEGVIEYGQLGGDPPRVRRDDEADWRFLDCEYRWHRPVRRALGDVIDALDSDRESVLNARTALQSTGIAFGIYESARRRGRVEFPLTIEDNPLDALLEDAP